MTRKVCIVGYAHSDVPIPDDHEVWVFNDGWCNVDRYDRLYELHNSYEIAPNPDHERHLVETDKPIYAFHSRHGRWNETMLPLEEMLAWAPRRYFMNTIAWLVAHALYEHHLGDTVERIMVRGVDLAVEHEFYLERPAVEYWLGYAEGKGIEVDTCDSLLLYGVGLYGVEQHTEAFRALDSWARYAGKAALYDESNRAAYEAQTQAYATVLRLLFPSRLHDPAKREEHERLADAAAKHVTERGY